MNPWHSRRQGNFGLVIRGKGSRFGSILSLCTAFRKYPHRWFQKQLKSCMFMCTCSSKARKWLLPPARAIYQPEEVLDWREQQSRFTSFCWTNPANESFLSLLGIIRKCSKCSTESGICAQAEWVSGQLCAVTVIASKACNYGARIWACACYDWSQPLQSVWCTHSYVSLDSSVSFIVWFFLS